MRKTIKGLETVIEKLKVDLQKTRNENRELKELLPQIMRMTDQLLAATCEKYGDKVEDIGYRIQIPTERVKSILDEYSVKAEKTDLIYTFGMVKYEDNRSTEEYTKTGI